MRVRDGGICESVACVGSGEGQAGAHFVNTVADGSVETRLGCMKVCRGFHGQCCHSARKSSWISWDYWYSIARQPGQFWCLALISLHGIEDGACLRLELAPLVVEMKCSITTSHNGTPTLPFPLLDGE
jgi:hypothetical protein